MQATDQGQRVDELRAVMAGIEREAVLKPQRMTIQERDVQKVKATDAAELLGEVIDLFEEVTLSETEEVLRQEYGHIWSDAITLLGDFRRAAGLNY